MLRRLLLLVVLLVGLSPARAQAQSQPQPRLLSLGGQLRSGTEPVAGAVLALLQPADSSMLAYAITDSQGRYTIELETALPELLLRVRSLGYRPQLRRIKAETQRLDLSLEREERLLREVLVKAQRLWAQRDTLNYLVSAYTLQQDRTIGDVLRRLPGITIEDNKVIKYQGVPINRFYIENLDLLRGRYNLATEGIKAEDVATVQVLEHHEPVRALQDQRPSQQAAINLRLKDKAKGVWSKALRLGAGAYAPGPLWDATLQASYFGKINGIVVNDADNTRIDTVEVTGANRAGVFFTSTATSLSGARQALIDHQISEADAPAGDNNQLLYSNLHHNRVAGAMIGYQRGFSADSNTAAYNGHEADGGTGYGIATLGGSYNFGVSYTRNITDHNYRKGLDSHEGNHIHIENNISNGDRLVGLGVSNHQFTMDNVTIRHNTIIADPNFRCTSDDGDKDAQIGQGENYHAYEGINLLTNIESNKIDLRSQGPGTFNISDNTIRGLETYNDANTSAIAVHNYEPTMDYTLNIRDNYIDATSVKTAIAINNATRGLGGSAGEGSGDIRVSGNTIHITKTGGRPSSLIYIAETEHDGTLRGSVAIENNRVQIDARDDKGEIIRLTGNAKTYDISGNVLEQHGNSNTTLITINGQGSTEKTTLNVHDNTLAADWPRPGKHWIEAGTESVAGAHIQSHNNTYNGAAITEDAPPAQNHAPDDITLTSTTIAEGQDGATVGKLTAHDPDSGDTHTYKTSDDRFEVAADGTLKLKAGQHLDYASEPTVKLTVTATDAGGLSTCRTTPPTPRPTSRAASASRARPKWAAR